MCRGEEVSKQLWLLLHGKLEPTHVHKGWLCELGLLKGGRMRHGRREHQFLGHNGNDEPIKGEGGGDDDEGPPFRLLLGFFLFLSFYGWRQDTHGDPFPGDGVIKVIDNISGFF